MVREILFVLLSCCSGAFAQQHAAARTGAYSPPVPKGKVEVSLHSTFSTSMLDVLVSGSYLIFQGTVLMTLPPIQLGNIPETVETPVVVAVDHLLKGTLDGNPRVMTMFQTGGTLGGLEVVVPEAPLMKPGEQYILFLRPALRILQPGESPRYYISGGWSGLIKIVDSKVQMSPGARQVKLRENIGDLLMLHDGASVDEFLTDLDDRIHMRGHNLKKTESRADIPWPVPADQR